MTCFIEKDTYQGIRYGKPYRVVVNDANHYSVSFSTYEKARDWAESRGMVIL